jgi:hypothetical protein
MRVWCLECGSFEETHERVPFPACTLPPDQQWARTMDRWAKQQQAARDHTPTTRTKGACTRERRRGY